MNNKNSKLLIIGASGHGKVIADIALKRNEWTEIAFLDDDKSKTEVMGFKVIDEISAIPNYIQTYQIIVGIGDNKVREKIFIQLEELEASIPILVHPDAVVGKNVKIGIGSVVMAGVVINSCTDIDKACIVNTGATIDHDCSVDSFVHISPGVHIAGAVKVGKGAWLGIGSIISNNLIVTRNCVIGAGSLVIKDIMESGTYIGIPAKQINTY